jgi:hypothetical protein
MCKQKNGPDASGNMKLHIECTKVMKDPVLSEKELNQIILRLSMEIRDEFPELSKFLGEIPDTVPVEDSPELILENLADYCASLKSLKDEYGHKHEARA